MTNPSTTPNADRLLSGYRHMIETANLDWQVAEYVRLMRVLHEHSANEVKAAAIAEIAVAQHGAAVFGDAVDNY